MSFERDQSTEPRGKKRELPDASGEQAPSSPSLPAQGDELKNVPPPGGFAHMWDWQKDLESPVYVDHDQGIAWVRISECPAEERETLAQWIEVRMMATPVISGIEPQDAVYVWDYAAFLEEFRRGELTASY